jgi:hypothetical protein
MKPGKLIASTLLAAKPTEVKTMRLYLCYENVQRPLAIDLPDNEVEGFLREYEEALHDTSVETFEWKNSCFRIAGLMAIVQKEHAAN